MDRRNLKSGKVPAKAKAAVAKPSVIESPRKGVELAKFEAPPVRGPKSVIAGAANISSAALAAAEPVSSAPGMSDKHIAAVRREPDAPAVLSAGVLPPNTPNTAAPAQQAPAPVVAAKSFPAAPPVSQKAEASAQPVVKDIPEMTIQSEIIVTPDATVTTASSGKETFAKVQDTAKTAYEKGAVVAGGLTAFTKGNIDALTESGKILGKGFKTLGQEYVGASKVAAGAVAADFKELTEVRSPADFFKLQDKILRRNIGVAFALSTKNSEALVKLSKDASAPLARRMKAGVGMMNITA